VFLSIPRAAFLHQNAAPSFRKVSNLCLLISIFKSRQFLGPSSRLSTDYNSIRTIRKYKLTNGKYLCYSLPCLSLHITVNWLHGGPPSFVCPRQRKLSAAVRSIPPIGRITVPTHPFFLSFIFNRLRTLLFSVGNSFACHSYENSRRGPQIFPLWNFAHASYYSLFALFTQRVFHNSFAIRRFRTLSRNCRVSPPSSHPRPHGMVAAKGTRIPPLTTRRILLYFHPLTNAPSRNSFPLTSLQMPGGWGCRVWFGRPWSLLRNGAIRGLSLFSTSLPYFVASPRF
jgi:hypothetical protein